MTIWVSFTFARLSSRLELDLADCDALVRLSFLSRHTWDEGETLHTSFPGRVCSVVSLMTEM